ncbi:tRNA lysidine(34) synthetase TilS [Celerinatantimonas sp. YJH-8]|uniref:tRNA lysidine(34) synthetase TilS n=1 Tax=Celerinatantimonas sp. YJH-8 TaxID=3228714 RepID=UPI0038C8ADB1
MLDFNLFCERIEALNASHASILIALSGGIDSIVLAHLLSRYQHRYPRQKLQAVHVHHGLMAQADDWQRFCQQFCLQLQIPFVAHQVKVEQGPRLSLEEQARKARYEIFSHYANQGYVIACAHHLDDQAETFLINLQRGSGAAGLAAMPVSRALGKSHLIRPLLDTSRVEIEQYALSHQLEHIEDPSNQDLRIERNFIRHQLLPIFKARWPHWLAQVGQSCQLLGQAQQLQDELALIDAERFITSQGALANDLSILSDARQNNLIRFWLHRLSGSYPSQQQLSQIRQQMGAREDRIPIISVAHGIVRRYRYRWYWSEAQVTASHGLVWPDPLSPVNMGKRQLVMLTGGTLRAPSSDDKISVRFRHEVDNPSMRPLGRNGSRSLKKLLQELAVPPWQRDHIPLIFYGEQWVALADQLIDERWAVADGSGLRLVIRSDL